MLGDVRMRDEKKLPTSPIPAAGPGAYPDRTRLKGGSERGSERSEEAQPKGPAATTSSARGMAIHGRSDL